MRRHKSVALKGRNNRNAPKAEIPRQQPLVPPFQGLSPDEQRPQGGVWRLTPPHLPWADMSRPFGAESKEAPEIAAHLQDLPRRSRTLLDFREKLTPQRVSGSRTGEA
jgi:hypothetical protein